MKPTKDTILSAVIEFTNGAMLEQGRPMTATAATKPVDYGMDILHMVELIEYVSEATEVTIDDTDLPIGQLKQMKLEDIADNLIKCLK